MSTPFPIEEQADQDAVNSASMSNPWNGPTKPGFFSGLGYNEENAYLGPSRPILGGIASAGYKVIAGASDALSSLYGAEGDLADTVARGVGLHPGKNPMQMMAEEMAATRALAQKNVEALSPNPETTGTAFRLVHGLSEGVSLAAAGGAAGGVGGAVALTGATEGMGTYQERLKAGVSPNVAAAEGGVSAVASGAGVLIPGGYGSTLATRLLTGAAANVGMGAAGRYADHKILEANGYTEMAAQQKVWDSTQVITDALLGVAFGGLAHLHGHDAELVKRAATEPGMTDAALAANLAVRDRASAPGVPVDPAASNAHQAALETATEQLLRGEPVDVSGTGVAEAHFLPRAAEDRSEAKAILDEHRLPEEIAAYNEYAFRASSADRAEEPEPPQLPELTKRNTVTPDAREDSILQYLAKHPEGLDSAEAEAQGIDKASFGDKTATVGIKRAFRKDGMSFDRAAEALHEQGYPVTDEQGNYSPNVLVDRISDELAGNPQHSTRNTRAELEAAHEKVYDDQMRASLHEAAPEFVHEDQATQDFATLAARAHEHDPEAVKQLLRSGSDAKNAEKLRAIVDEGTHSQLREYEVAQGAAVHREVAGSQGSVGANGEARPAGTAGSGETRPIGSQPGQPATGQEPGAGRVAGDARLADTVHAALAERPKLEITNDDGKPVVAADLLRQVQEDAAREMADFQKAVTAATSCFGRRGA